MLFVWFACWTSFAHNSHVQVEEHREHTANIVSKMEQIVAVCSHCIWMLQYCIRKCRLNGDHGCINLPIVANIQKRSVVHKKRNSKNKKTKKIMQTMWAKNKLNSWFLAHQKWRWKGCAMNVLRLLHASVCMIVCMLIINKHRQQSVRCWCVVFR